MIVMNDSNVTVIDDKQLDIKKKLLLTSTSPNLEDPGSGRKGIYPYYNQSQSPSDANRGLTTLSNKSNSRRNNNKTQLVTKVGM